MSDQLPSCMMPDGAAPCQGYAELLDESDALRAELEQIKNPWISVEDGLPEEHEIIDGLQYEDERMIDIEFYDGSFFGPDQDFSVDDDGYGCFTNTDKLKGITHWMRRPKLEGQG